MYLTEVFNDTGVFKSLQDFWDILTNRYNCENNIIRIVITSILFDMKYCVLTRFDFVNASNLHYGVQYINGVHFIHVFNKNIDFITKKNICTVSTHKKNPKEYEW